MGRLADNVKMKMTRRRNGLASKFVLSAAAMIGLVAWVFSGRPASLAAITAPPPGRFENTVGMTFVQIPAGQFVMGSPENEDGRDTDETQHSVTISKNYYMSAVPVTQAQWVVVMNGDPSRFLGDLLPVEQVTWFEAVDFCRKLSAMEGKHYRLPTEAEWEYACRAETTSQYNTGDGTAAMAVAGWYMDNADGRTHPVGEKNANSWGLFDMHGNVWQWCSDVYDDYPDGAATDPTGPASGKRRVCRGGSWNTGASECRSAARNDLDPKARYFDCGFRVVMDAE
jgi:formylglycine-generating enzyme required for sulfatase activity